MKAIISIISLLLTVACAQNKASISTNDSSETKQEVNVLESKVTLGIDKDSIKDFSALTEAQWKQILTKQEYYVLREKGTERAFSGKYVDFKNEGTFVCKGCATPLYSSETKFKSGTGWPSFYDEIDNNVLENEDNSFGMKRVEIVCTTCKGHLGHVFNDGPKPTGLRHCVNSVSLDFVPN